MTRRWFFLTVFLLAVLATLAGCAVSGGPGNPDNSGNERADTASDGETTASGPGRTRVEPAQEVADLKVETVSAGQAYVLAGFGAGSVWAIDLFACDDTSAVGSSAPSDGGSGACGVSAEADLMLKRLDPRTGREEAEVALENFFANTVDVAYGAGSVWACSADYFPGPADDTSGSTVFKIDPGTNRVVDRIPVPTSTSVAFGRGSVWVTSPAHPTMSRIDPGSGRVVAEIGVGRGALDVAVDEKSVWVAGVDNPESYTASTSPGYDEDRKLSRVDPETNRVIAEIPIKAGTRYGGAEFVAAGEGSVWASSGGELFGVDPATNEVKTVVRVGDYTSDLEVSDGAVWASVQDPEARLVRLDPQTGEVTGTADLGPVETVGYGRLAAGAGSVWATGGATRTGEAGLARVAP